MAKDAACFPNYQIKCTYIYIYIYFFLKLPFQNTFKKHEAKSQGR